MPPPAERGNKARVYADPHNRVHPMRIGLLSDTHDNLSLVDAAVDRLNRERVGLVLHAGDYVAPFVIPRLARLDAPLIGVYGNNDGDRRLLEARFAEHENLEIRGFFAAVTAGNSAIGLLHGDDQELLKALIDRSAFDVVVHGHTHRAYVRKAGATVVVNPGEVCGYLTGEPSVGVLDAESLDAEIIYL
jgi:uncharacterized protein